MKTIRRVPISLPVNGAQLKSNYYNQTGFLGQNENNNYLEVPQNSFKEAYNVFVDENNLLKSRPAVRPFVNSIIDSYNDHLVDIKRLGDILVLYRDIEGAKSLIFVGKLISTYNVKNDNFPKLLQMEGDIYWYDGELKQRKFYGYNEIDRVYDATSRIYIPITRTASGAVIKDFESKNMMTSKERTTLLYQGDEIDDVLMGEELVYKIYDPDAMEDVEKTKMWQFGMSKTLVSKSAQYNFIDVKKAQNASMYVAWDKNTIFYSVDGIVYSSLGSPCGTLDNVKIGENYNIYISDDGKTIFVLKGMTVYKRSLLRNDANVYDYPNWFSDNMMAQYDSLGISIKDIAGAHFYDDYKYIILLRLTNNTMRLFTHLDYKIGDRSISYNQLSTGVIPDHNTNSIKLYGWVRAEEGYNSIVCVGQNVYVSHLWSIQSDTDNSTYKVRNNFIASLSPILSGVPSNGLYDMRYVDFKYDSGVGSDISIIRIAYSTSNEVRYDEYQFNWTENASTPPSSIASVHSSTVLNNNVGNNKAIFEENGASTILTKDGYNTLNVDDGILNANNTKVYGSYLGSQIFLQQDIDKDKHLNRYIKMDSKGVISDADDKSTFVKQPNNNLMLNLPAFNLPSGVDVAKVEQGGHYENVYTRKYNPGKGAYESVKTGTKWVADYVDVDVPWNAKLVNDISSQGFFILGSFRELEISWRAKKPGKKYAIQLESNSNPISGTQICASSTSWQVTKFTSENPGNVSFYRGDNINDDDWIEIQYIRVSNIKQSDSVDLKINFVPWLLSNMTPMVNTINNIILMKGNTLYTRSESGFSLTYQSSDEDTSYFDYDDFELLDELYLVKGNSLYITFTKRDINNKFMFYVPLYSKVDFDSKILGIKRASSDTVLIFLETSIYCAKLNTDGTDYFITKSKIELSIRPGDDVTTTYDGSFVLYPTIKGIALMGYQQFMSTDDQKIETISSNISSQIKGFIDKGNIFISQYKHWYIFADRTKKEWFLFDSRSASWWNWNMYKCNSRIVEWNQKPCIIWGDKLCFLEDDAEDYSDDGEYIYWYVLSQRLHLGAPNNYKRVHQLILNNLNEKYEENFLQLISTNYRSMMFESKPELIRLVINFIRTHVHRVNYMKTNAYQYLLASDENVEQKTQLRLSNISIKYTVGEEVR